MIFTPLEDNKEDKPAKKQGEDSPVVKFAEEIIQTIFGKEEAIHAKPLFLKNRTLTITCTSQIMAQEIRIHQQDIIDQVNDKLGKKEVDRIRYLL